MNVNRNLLSNTLLIGLIILIFGFLFVVFQKLGRNKYETIDAIPKSTSLFIQFNSMDELHQDLKKNNIWKNLMTLPELNNFSEQIAQFDSVLHANNRNNALINHQNGIISLHHNYAQSEALMVFKLKKKLNHRFFKSIFNEVFGNTFTILKTAKDGESFSKVVFNKNSKSFNYTLRGGLFIGSWSESLLLESVEQLKSDQSLKHDESYKKVKELAGKKVDANLFINYAEFPNFMKILSNKDSLSQSTQNILKSIADWTELDLIIKNDEFLLSGFTSSKDSTNTYFELFKNQTPQTFQMAGIIPYNATYFRYLGLDNFSVFFSDHQDFLDLTEDSSVVLKRKQSFNQTINKRIKNSLLKNIGKELALISTATNQNNFEESSYAIIKTTNQIALKKSLDQLALKFKGSGLLKNHQTHPLYRINGKGIIPLLLGSGFNVIQQFHYTFINNYLVVANSTKALENYINTYKSGRTLDLDPNFIAFSDNMAEKANFFSYFNLRFGQNLLSKFINEKIYEFINKNTSKLKSFNAVGIQYAHQPRGLFTNIYLNYNPNIKLENKAIWQAKLDYNIIGSPQLLKNHNNAFLYPSVFDAGNQLYLFNQDGKKLWQYRTDGPIMGKIFEVDYYKNGKIQYLFNTKSSIYLVDINGKNVADYPHKLHIEASNGIAVFDYARNKNYRIVFAGTDKKIYNYNIDCKEVKGWNKAQSLNPVTDQIQHLVANRRDYILFADQIGNPKILNRLGKDRILFKSQFSKAKHSKFYVNKTNNKGLFLTTNSTGKLTYISSIGNLSYSDFGNYSNQHHFKYFDFNNDGHHDFIYLDQNVLKVFDRFKQEILHYHFNHKISSEPFIFKGTGGKAILGIYDSNSQNIYLFDEDGLLETSEELRGNSRFSIGDLSNNGSINLLVGSDETFKSYRIK